MNTSLVGQILLDQFRVDAFIASGGMGAVYRVWDLKRNVPLAMKVLHADLADDPSIFKRFQREARALQRLAHPNIVPFYGLYHTDDLAFLLERFIDGPSLKDILRQRKGSSMPVDEALIYLKAVSSALGYAHAHGVVHCDVKPGNVMIDRGGSVYLTDFGVARHAESTTTTLGFAGTAGYMAPEQVRGDPVSPATDVYALGVMLYEMLAGERPFRGDERETEGKGSTGAERVRWAHLHLPPPDPRLKNPILPPELTQVILKALAKDPKERFADARGLYEAAVSAARLEPSAVGDRAGPQSLPAPGIVSAAESPFEQAGRKLPDNRGVLGKVAPSLAGGKGAVVVGSIGVLSLVVILFFISGVGGNTDRVTQTGGTGAEASRGAGGSAEATGSPGAVLATSTSTRRPPTPRPTSTSSLLGYDLAFASDRDGDFDVFLTSSDGTGDWVRLERPSGYDLAWWPSFCGGAIASEVSGGNKPQWIYWLYPDGKSPQPWSPPGSADKLGVPRCSPDGRFLAYSAQQGSDWNLVVVDLEHNSEVYTMDPSSGFSITGYASWPNVDNELFFMAYRASSKTYEVLRALNFTHAMDVSPTRAGGTRITQWKYPAMSPNGDQQAFICQVGGEDRYLCVGETTSGETNRLQLIHYVKVNGQAMPGGTPMWSSDGRWIYYASADDGDWDIYRIHPDGSNRQNVTSGWGSNELMPALRW